MLKLVGLIFAGLAGAFGGWLLGAYLGLQGLEHIVVRMPVSGQPLADLQVPDICAGIGLAAGIALAMMLGRWRGAGWMGARGLLAAVLAGAVLYGGAEAASALFGSMGLNPLAPEVEFEIRLPEGSGLPQRDDIQIELHTDRNQTIATLIEIQRNDGRPTVRGTAPLTFRTVQRQIVMSLSGQPVRVFRIRLPAAPPPAAAFGAWQQVDFVGDATTMLRRADFTAGYAIRYRVK